MPKKFDLSVSQGSSKATTLDDPFLRDMLGCGNASLSMNQTESNEISLDLLTPWQDEDNSTQPFKRYSQDKLMELAADMDARGLDNPIIVRPFGDGYQILAGHNRYEAAKIINWTKIPAKIVDVDDDAARLILVNTNLLQRDKILHSEKARAYKIQLEAMKRQAGRPAKENSGQVDLNLFGKQSRDVLAEQSNESSKQIQRYIRLNELTPPLLDMVDAEQLPFTVGVSLSYLSPPMQTSLNEIMQEYDIQTMNGKQADFFKSRGDSLDEDTIRQIFGVTAKSAEPRPKSQKSINIKIPSDIWGDLPANLAKDPELIRRFAAVIAEFVSEQKTQTNRQEGGSL